MAVELGIGFMILFILMAYFAAATAVSDPLRLLDLTTASLHTLWLSVPITLVQEVTTVGIAILFVWLVERKAAPLKALGLRPLKGSLKPFAAGMALGTLLILGTLALSLAAGFTAYGGTGVTQYGLPATAFSFAALPIGPSELTIDAYPVFVFSTSKDIILGGFDLGRGMKA